MSLSQFVPGGAAASIGDGIAMVRAVCAEIRALPDKDRVLFPHGITSIEVDVKGGLSPEVSVKVSGPQT